MKHRFAYHSAGCFIADHYSIRAEQGAFIHVKWKICKYLLGIIIPGDVYFYFLLRQRNAGRKVDNRHGDHSTRAFEKTLVSQAELDGYAAERFVREEVAAVVVTEVLCEILFGGFAFVVCIYLNVIC